tara:strand:- start:371 stop:1282 length:912 start_codon:yes stop_codon:yes gene_type:complete
MKKNNLKNIAGVTLVEILIGVVITAIMMAAIFTSYTVVNNSYSQVTDRAKISTSGRDIVGMLMRDIRMAGFKYFFGVNSLGIPTSDNLQYVAGDDATTFNDSHAPLVVVKDTLGYDRADPDLKIDKLDGDEDTCCDRIHIVYGDFNQNDHATQPYKKYRITYFADIEAGNDYYSVFKTKESWIQENDDVVGSWSDTCTICYTRERVRDHIVDMEFIVTDKEGKILNPPPRPDEPSSKDLFNIRIVDVRLTFRSNKPFYRDEVTGGDNPRLVKGIGDRTREFFDRFLRDSVVVSVHTRNIGSDL